VLVVNADRGLHERGGDRRLRRRIAAHLPQLDVLESIGIQMRADQPKRLLGRLIRHESGVELRDGAVRQNRLHSRPGIAGPHPVDVQCRVEQVLHDGFATAEAIDPPIHAE
jgi:hypothetical protein